MRRAAQLVNAIRPAVLVSGLGRNRSPASNGNAVRHRSESVSEMDRNHCPDWVGIRRRLQKMEPGIRIDDHYGYFGVVAAEPLIDEIGFSIESIEHSDGNTNERTVDVLLLPKLISVTFDAKFSPAAKK